MSGPQRAYPAEKMVDPLELRQAARVGADHPVQIHCSGLAGSLAGRTRDLSVGGLCVATPSPFDVKSLHRVTLQLPDRHLTLRCEGRWQRDEPADDLVLTGLEFEDLSSDERDALWSLVLQTGRELASFLHERAELHELGLEEAMGLAQVTRYRDIPAGHSLYRQDQRREGEESLFLLLQGEVVLTVRVRDARDVEIARLRPGDLFGGLPLLADCPNAESATAATSSRLLEIDDSAFRYVRLAKPWLGYRLGSALLRVNARRLRDVLGTTRDRL